MERRPTGNGRDVLPSMVRTTPPFVGRQHQLQWVDTCLQEAATGHPSVVFVAGEAGVGKTRLLTEMRTLAQRHSVKVYYGRCYEDLALPYLPFVRTVFEEVVDGIQTLPPDMHSDAEVIRSFLRQGSVAAAAPHDSMPFQTDQGKLQLFLAVSRATILLAQQRPCILVADDLHWADSPTLDLFTYLVFSLADAAMRESVPICLMAAYRPVAAVDRLGRLLARVQREIICRTLELSALDEPEVYELIQSLGIRRPSHQLVTTVNQVTRGNPLFIQEMVYHLRQQGALQERGGFVVTTTSVEELRLPQHVHVALAARTQDLSEDQQRIFALAACLGERFSLRLLSAVSGVDEEPLLDIVEDGVERHFFVSDDQGFQFAHPLIRHAVLSTISTARQQRLHYRIAQTLEQMDADRLVMRVLNMARHLIAAGPVAEASKVMDYAYRAGDHAFAMFSWGAAAHYYEAALRAAASTLSGSPQAQATLHYRAGLAYHRNQDVGPCLDHYDRAIAAYQQTEDVAGLGRVLLEKTRIQYTLAAVPPGTLLDVQPLQDMLHTLPETDLRLCGEIAAVLAEAYWTAKQTDKAYAMGQRALDIGQYLEDDALCSYAYFVIGMAQGQELHLSASLESWQKSWQCAQRTNDASLSGLPLPRLPAILIILGNLPEAEAVVHKALAVIQETQDWSAHSVALSHLTVLAAIRGNFEAARAYADETMHMVTRSHYPWGGARALLVLVGAHACRGEWEAATAMLDALEEPGGLFPQPGEIVQVFVRVFRLLVQAYTGCPHSTDLESLVVNLRRLAGNDTYALSPYCAVIELGDLMGVPAIGQGCFQALQVAIEKGALFSLGWPFLIPRVLGLAATAQGLWEQAETYFSQAQAIAANVEAWPELGRTYLDWAQLLLARDAQQGRQQALELAQQANQIFAEYSMQPFIQRAARLIAHCQEPFLQERTARRDWPPWPGVVQENRALRLAWRRTRFLG